VQQLKVTFDTGLCPFQGWKLVQLLARKELVTKDLRLAHFASFSHHFIHMEQNLPKK
jgi:hypothetical protein